MSRSNPRSKTERQSKQPSETSGSTFNISGEVHAGVVNLGGDMKIDQLSISLPASGETPAGQPASEAILFLAADPINAPRLRLEAEARQVHELLQRGDAARRFRFETRWAVRPRDLSQALLDLTPRLVHFAGHGTPDGQLCLEDDNGQACPVSPQKLAALFELVAENVECVLLDACFVAIQAQAIAKHIRYVIGMPGLVSDRASMAFVTGFYQALAVGKPIPEAFRFGQAQMEIAGLPPEMRPVLLEANK